VSLLDVKFCPVNMIIRNINKSYVDGKQALPHCQSVILPIPPVQPGCEKCQTTCYLQLKNTPVS